MSAAGVAARMLASLSVLPHARLAAARDATGPCSAAPALRADGDSTRVLRAAR
jgi:hypothetical protein